MKLMLDTISLLLVLVAGLETPRTPQEWFLEQMGHVAPSYVVSSSSPFNLF